REALAAELVELDRPAAATDVLLDEMDLGGGNEEADLVAEQQAQVVFRRLAAADEFDLLEARDAVDRVDDDVARPEFEEAGQRAARQRRALDGARSRRHAGELGVRHQGQAEVRDAEPAAERAD